MTHFWMGIEQLGGLFDLRTGGIIQTRMKANIKISRGIAGRITITFPYHPVRVVKIKAIEGSRWHPDERCWSIPHSDGIVEKILSTFDGEKVDIDPSLPVGKEKTGAGRDFADLRRELTLRKYSRKIFSKKVAMPLAERSERLHPQVCISAMPI